MAAVRIWGVLLVLLLSVTAPMEAESQSLAEKKEIVLGGSDSQKNGFYGRWLDLIYTEAFKRLGYKFRYMGVPAKRSSVLSDAGKTDGEISRVSSYGELHSNLVKVQEPSFVTRFSAYSARKGLVIDGWQSLKGKDIHVDYLRGIKLITSKLPHYVEADRTSEVNSNVAGLKRLLLKRSDVFIGGESNIDEILMTDRSFRQKEITKVGVIEEISVHAWLHNKNATLAPQLSKVLQEMKTEGLISKFKIQAQ
ncbi:hypothetical protein A9Q83_18630 [Alphaproteobacteria bacterium 46_93_T64]|nr:hypothetical protein A9Q83_18630 [Alphaproteobacteria bacterium 46_93_T64]